MSPIYPIEQTRDKLQGGALHVHVRLANQPFRNRYAHYDSRGTLSGKRASREHALIRAQRRPVHTITADNGIELHVYKPLEVTLRDCTRVATKLNQRPRKCLGFRTP